MSSEDVDPGVVVEALGVPIGIPVSGEDAARLSRMTQTMRQVARQASLDPGDGIEL